MIFVDYRTPKKRREPMWSHKDIADYANVSASTIYRWFREDGIQPCESTVKRRKGGTAHSATKLYSRSKVLAYLAARKAKEESQCN